MDKYRSGHPSDPRLKNRNSDDKRRSRSPRKRSSYRRSRSRSSDRYRRRRSRSPRSRDRHSSGIPPPPPMIETQAYYGGGFEQYGNAVFPAYPDLYGSFGGYMAAPVPPMLAPPGEEFVPAAPMWTKEDEDTKRKREAAIAEEKRNQRKALEKQRDDYRQRATALGRELDVLKKQRKDLQNSSRSPSPTSLGFIRENDKLQSQIQGKLSTIQNVIEMLTDIIQKDHSETSPKRPRTPSNPSAVEETSSSYNIVHFDPEVHWCKHCNEFPKTAKDYLNHLHSEKHRERQTVEYPWREKFEPDDFPALPDAPTKRVPIRGLPFFIPSQAWFCKLCSMWMGDFQCASQHLKSQTHAAKYTEYMQHHPKFEIDWTADRQKALDQNAEKVVKRQDAPSEVKDLQKDVQKVMQAIQDQKTGDKKKRKKHKKDEAKEKKRRKKKKHDSSSSSSSSSSSDSDSSSSSSSTDSSDDEEKLKQAALQSEQIRIAMRKIEEEKSKLVERSKARGSWTSVGKDKPKERSRSDRDLGPKIIEFTEKSGSRNAPKSSSASRRYEPPSSVSKPKREEPKIIIRPKSPPKQVPPPPPISRIVKAEAPKKVVMNGKDSSSESKTDAKSKLIKKLPIIGRMPVFKKQQQLEEKEKQKRREEEEQKFTEHSGVDMEVSNDYEELMPDPLHFALMNAAPPPPPPLATQPLPIIPVEDDKPVLPPGIDEHESDSIPQPINDAPIQRKGPLPRDFQDALNILFDGAPPPEPQELPVPVTTASDAFYGIPMQPPPEEPVEHEEQEERLPDSSPPPVLKSQKPIEIDDLAMLGIDASDLAAQCF